MNDSRSISANALKRKDSLRGLIPSWLKNAVIHIMTSDLVSGVLRYVYQNKIPHRGGVKILTDSPLISNDTCGAIYFGVYERAEIDQVVAYCDFSLPIIEVGASIGVGTLQILQRAKGKVVVVEADPELYSLLLANVEHNQANHAGFHAHNAMIHYAGDKRAAWHQGGDNLTGHAARGDANDVMVDCITLSELLAQHAIHEYNLVVDIEGAEAELFNLEQEALSHCHFIMAEIDGGLSQGHSYSIRELVDRVVSYGFKVIHQHGNRVTFQNITVSD